jgi:thioredoxin-dependent adenylylsulfate APS reductase
MSVTTVEAPRTRVAEDVRPVESAGAEEILRWGIEYFGDRLAICTAFQASGMVILDMAVRISRNVKVFTIDTGRLPEETHRLISDVRERYGIEIETVMPEAAEVASMVSSHGPNLFYDSVANRRLCCEIRKVRPLNRRLAKLEAWVVGLRRQQSETRETIQKITVDEAHGGILKLAPLADWTREEVWEYIRRHNVPYHELYWQGFSSIGCAPCTRAVQEGEEERAGRWWWEQEAHKECGIHVAPNGAVRRELDVLLADVLRKPS